MIREIQLKNKFGDAAERILDAQLTAEQLATLRSIQYFYTNDSEQRVGACARWRASLIGALIIILLVTVVCFTLSPLSQLAAILLECCGLQVKCCFIAKLLQLDGDTYLKVKGCDRRFTGNPSQSCGASNLRTRDHIVNYLPRDTGQHNLP